MKFIVGIIYSDDTKEYKKNKIEAVAVYDTNTDNGEYESISNIEDLLKKGHRIAGVDLKTKMIYKAKIENYYCQDKLELNKNVYDYRKLPIVDGQGNIIKDGNKTLVGTVKGSKETQYVAVDAQFNIEIIPEDKVDFRKYNGVTVNNIVCKMSRYKVQL